MAAVTVQLLIRDSEAPEGWKPDRPRVRSEDDLLHRGEEKAAQLGQAWVEKDPENRRYEVRFW